MFGAKTVVVVVLLSVFLQARIKANAKDSCSQLKEECEFQIVENFRLRGELESERQTIKTLESVNRAQTEENRKLNLENERLQLRRQRVTATFIGSFDQSQTHRGITKVEDKIYVLKSSPNRISVYEDLIGFRFMTDIALNGTSLLANIVYSNESKCVYISDNGERCIWMMTTTGEHRLTKWLNNVTKPHTLSLSNEGHLLVLRQSQSISQDSLEIYSLNATLIRSLHLPQDIKDPRHVVQTSEGNFIILHRLNNPSTGPWLISQLTNDGQLIHRFIPRNKSEILINPSHLSLDSVNNRIFVVDFWNYQVILFDSSCLTWSQVLLSEEMNGLRDPWRLFYDASKKHLFLAEHYDNVTVYEIN